MKTKSSRPRCKSGRCFSPLACDGFGYCREENKQFKINIRVVPPKYLIDLGLDQMRDEIRIVSGRTLEEAKERAGIQ